MQKEQPQEATYNELRSSFKTGDILLFEGTGLISEAIKLITQSKFSHVGMIIVSEDLDCVFCWESTTLSSVKDAETGRSTKGVQLVLLSDRLATYKGGVSVRRLLHEDNEELQKHDLMLLSVLRQKMKGVPYEENEIELLASVIDFCGMNGGEEDLSSAFCSELVAEAYQEMSLVPPCKPSNEYTPADFSVENKLELLHGFYLGEEIKIKRK